VKKPIEIAPPEARAVNVRIPKGLLFPINPAGPVDLSVTAVDGQKFNMLVGGVGPLSGDTNASFPGLCLRHFRLLLKILFNRRFDAPEVPITFSELVDTFGSKKLELIRRTLSELACAWVHIVDEKGKVTAQRLMEFDTQIYYRAGVDPQDPRQIGIEANILKRHLRRVHFNEYFWRAFLNWSECWNIRADVIQGIYSDTAAACYLVLSTRAYHPTIHELNRGRKDAAELLKEIGAKVPGKMSDLRRCYERRRSDDSFSLLEQIDGKPTWRDFLRVQTLLEENERGTGFNVRFWLGKGPTSADTDAFQRQMRDRGVLYEYWESLRLPPQDFDRLQQAQLRKLEHYEEEILLKIGYSLERNRKFAELVRSFIGPMSFAQVLHEAKDAEMTGKIRGTVDQFVTGILRNRFKEFSQAYAGRSR
jgi:hypothetical protein